MGLLKKILSPINRNIMLRCTPCLNILGLFLKIIENLRDMQMHIS